MFLVMAFASMTLRSGSAAEFGDRIERLRELRKAHGHETRPARLPPRSEQADADSFRNPLSVTPDRPVPGPRRPAPAPVTAALPGPIEERFQVNAQYRGTVRKSFEDIGEGTLKLHPLEDGVFRVEIQARIRNPEKGTIYEFWIDMAFALDGQTVRVVENLNDFNNAGKGFQARIERAVPFLYLARHLASPGYGERTFHRFMYMGSPFTIRLGGTRTAVEATILDGDRMVTKAFLERARSGRTGRYLKFRVPAPGSVMVSFVIQS